jgi:osmoprotectant transport system permease protein
VVFDYMIKNSGEVFRRLIEHMQITLFAVLLAIVIGVPLGILVSKNKKLGNGILAVANVFQTIPSLALFGFIIPLPVIGGIGYRPAVIVLFLYALLPIIKNTYIGIEGVDDAIVESARGMGMTPIQILFMVTLPISFPVLMGGIRVATVINIGTATIASLIGAGGLGDFIFRGISMSDNSIILAGAIPTTILALLIDSLMGLAEKKASASFFGKIVTDKKMRRNLLIVTTSIVLAIVGISIYQKRANKNTIIIGTKNFTESRVLGSLLENMLEENSDLKVEVRELGGTLPNFQALQSKDIDMYVEYTGTGYITILKKEGNIPSSDEVYNIVKKEFNEKYNTTWLKPLGFNNTYTLAVKKETAEKYNLKTLSDLVPYSNQFTFGATAEVLERPDGYPGLRKLYGYEFKEIKSLDPGLRYNAIGNDEVQVIDAFSTDGKLTELNLVILQDDKEYFPPYYAVPVVNNSTIESNPEIQSILYRMENILSDEEMRQLNYRVDVKKEAIEDVARSFLQKKGLIGG